MKLTLMPLLIAVCLTTIQLNAQSPGSCDTNYVTLENTDAAPSFVLPLTEGKVLTGGSFTNYGNSGHAGLVRLNANGTVDLSYTVPAPKAIQPPILNGNTVLFAGSTNAGSILAAVVRPDGRTVIQGIFTHLGMEPIPSKVALINDDGSLAPFSTSLELPGRASLLQGPGNSVYFGGSWNLVDTVRPVIQRLNADGSNDPTFVSPTPGSLGYAAGSIRALIRGPGDTIYAVVNSTAQEVFRLTASGALDPSFGDGGRALGTLSTIRFASNPSGQLLLGGNGAYRGQTLSSSLTRLTLGGAIDLSFVAPPGVSLSGDLDVQADNKVVGLSASGAVAARFNENGSRDSGYVDPGKVPVSLPVFIGFDVAIAPDGSAFAAALFYNAQFKTFNGIIHILGDPNTPPAIATQPLAQTNTLGARTRFSIAAQGASPLRYQWFRGNTPIDGANTTDLILPHTTYNDDADFHCLVSNGLGTTPSAVVHLTLLNPVPGTVYRETDVPAGPDGEVRDLIFDVSGGLLATGQFFQWNNTNRNNLARLVPGTDELDPAFGSTALDGGGLHLVSLPAGKVLGIGYRAINYNGKTHEDVFRFNANASVDLTFNPDGVGKVSGLYSSTARPVVGPDGKVVLFGQSWNGEVLSSPSQGTYFRLNENGTRDLSFALRGSSYSGASGAIAALPNGQYLVSASTNANAFSANGVLLLNTDGTVDPTFFIGSPHPLGTTVNDILVQPDGRILLGGTFSVRSLPGGGSLVVGVARLLSDGHLDRSFNAVPRLSQSPDFSFGDVRRLSLQADGRIVAIGRPLNGTFPRGNLVRYWPSGALDPEFQVATNSNSNNNALYAVAVRADNAIFVGGNFTEFSRFSRKYFVHLNGGPLSPTPPVPTILSQTERIVAKVGTNVTFTVVPSGNGPFQFQWRHNESPGSTNFVDLVGSTNSTLTIQNLRLTPQSDAGLYQCGVVNPGGAVYSSVMPLLIEPEPALPGQLDPSFIIAGSLAAKNQQTVANPDGSLYALVDGNLVHLYEDGTQDTSFNPPADLFVRLVGGLSAVKRQSDGKILIAGKLKDGILARLMPDGSYDPAFNRFGGLQANAMPSQIELQSDGKILLCLTGGQFTGPGGKVVISLGRFMPDGNLDDTFQPLELVNLIPGNGPSRGTLIAFRILPDNRIYISGGFSQAQNAVRHGVARLNADGSLDTSFVPPTNASASGGTFGTMLFYQLGPISAVGGVYIFGQFTQPASNALRLLPDGSIDPAFNLSTINQIEGGILQSDDKLIFSFAGSLGRANLDGSIDASWQKSQPFTYQLSILADGKLLAGNRRFFTGIGPAVTAAELGFTHIGGKLELTWPGSFKLQRATQLVPGDWMDLPNLSPYAVPLLGPGVFFRVVRVP